MPIVRSGVMYLIGPEAEDIPEAVRIWVGKDEGPSLAGVGRFVEAGKGAFATRHDDGRVGIEGLDAAEVEVLGVGWASAVLPVVAAVFVVKNSALGAGGPGDSLADGVNATKIYDRQSLNLYSYTGNNPLSRFDPDGHLDCSGGATQDVACAVTAAAKAVWHFFSGGGSSDGLSVTTSQQDNLSPEQMGQPQSLMPRDVGISAGAEGETGLFAGHGGLAGRSGNYDFKSNHFYGTEFKGFTVASGVYPNAHQSPDPKDWILGIYAGGGLSVSASNGTEAQMNGPARSFNVNGRILPYGIGVSYSYTGSFWKPGVYNLSVSPPYVNWVFGAAVSSYTTNTTVVDSDPQ